MVRVRQAAPLYKNHSYYNLELFYFSKIVFFYKFLKIFLTRDRNELYDRINKRVDIMISKGLIDEARKIYDKYEKSLYKISSIGYKELFLYFDGKITLEEAVDEIKRESRRYAKRQMTWFRKEKNYITYNLSEVSENKIIKDILKKWEKF